MQYRLLDQSIAISSQFKNGKKAYLKYLQLHSKQDLDEAQRHYESDLNCHKQQAQETLDSNDVPQVDDLNYNSNLSFGMEQNQILDQDPWDIAVAPPLDPMMYAFGEDMILESFDIKNSLMNPHMEYSGVSTQKKEVDSTMSTTFTPMVEFPTKDVGLGSQRTRAGLSIFGEPGILFIPIDSHAFVKLIQNERYWWLLDLFNNLDVWKSMVPNYCVRIVQASELDDKARNRKNPTFLLDCLMDCKEFTSMDRILHNAKEQQLQWQEFELKDVNASSFRNFEQISLSVVLIILSMLLQASKPTFVITDTFNMVLTNQGRMIRKLVMRYQRIPAAMLKSMSTTIFTSVSFQAIIILRFFLKMQLRKIDVTYDYAQIPYSEGEAIQSLIAYDPSTTHNVGEFFTITPFEEDLLTTQFQDMEIVELELASLDALKLRQFFWSLVMFENYGTKDGEFAEVDNVDKSPKLHALRPNEQCIALNILKAYADKSGNGIDNSLNHKLHEIFEEINMSTMGQDMKLKWMTHFQWTTEV